MKRFAISAMAMLFALAISASAQADALSLLTVNDGDLDDLEDIDYESVIDVDGSFAPSVGDIFIGIFTLETINNISTEGSGASFSGLLIAAIDTYTDNGAAGFGATDRLTFRAVTAAEYASLIAGTAATGGVALTNLPTRNAATSALIVFDDSSSPFIDPGPQLGLSASLATIFGAINTAIGTAVDGTPVFEFGFPVGDTLYAETAVTAGNNLKFSLALNLTWNGTPIELGYIASGTSEKYQVDDLTDLPIAQLHLSGNTNAVDPVSGGGAASGNSNTGAFQYRTTASMRINAVPEPGSLTLFGLGALGLLGGARLRRKNAA